MSAWSSGFDRPSRFVLELAPLRGEAVTIPAAAMQKRSTIREHHGSPHPTFSASNHYGDHWNRRPRLAMRSG